MRGLADAVVQVLAVDGLPRGFGHFGYGGDFQPGLDHAAANVLVRSGIGVHVDQRSINEARHQVADLDLVGRPFGIEAFGQCAHAELGSGIDRGPRCAIDSGGAGGVEQARTRRAGLQPGVRGLRAEQHAFQVDVQAAFDLGRVVFDQAAAQRDAGIVEHHVDPPAAGLGAVGEGHVPRLAVPNIQFVNGIFTRGEHGCGFAGSGFVDVGNPDEPALLAELDRNRAPDARSAAGNEDRLVHPLNPPIVPYIAVSRAYRAGLL